MICRLESKTISNALKWVFYQISKNEKFCRIDESQTISFFQEWSETVAAVDSEPNSNRETHI